MLGHHMFREFEEPDADFAAICDKYGMTIVE